MNLQDMLKQRMETLNYADSIQSAAKDANRATTSTEESIMSASMAKVAELDKQIAERAKLTTLTPAALMPGTRDTRAVGQQDQTTLLAITV